MSADNYILIRKERRDNIVVASDTLKFLMYNGTQDDISTVGGTLNFKMYDGTVDNINLI